MSQLIAMFCDIDDFCKWFEPLYMQRLLQDGQRHRVRQSQLAVAYLMVADKYLGPLASRLSGVNQPVICPPTVFSTHHRTLVTCIGAYLNRSTPAYQPPLFLRLSGAVATAVPDRGAPLSATIRGPSVPPPSLAYTAATASPRQFWGAPREPLTAGASSHGVGQSCGTSGTIPADPASSLRPGKGC